MGRRNKSKRTIIYFSEKGDLIALSTKTKKQKIFYVEVNGDFECETSLNLSKWKLWERVGVL